LTVTAAGLAAVFAGAGVMAASSQRSRKGSRARRRPKNTKKKEPRPPPARVAEKTPKRAAAVVDEEELAFLSRNFEPSPRRGEARKDRRTGLDTHRCRCKRTDPCTRSEAVQLMRLACDDPIREYLRRGGKCLPPCTLSRPRRPTRLACDDPIREYLRAPYASEPCE
jgi:hypothetical protein